MRTDPRGVVTTIAVLAAVIGGGASAQEPSGRPPVLQKPRAPPAPPRTVVGIVLDTGGVPIDSVEIRIAVLQRRTFSDANGVFRFDEVKPGSYMVQVTSPGFARKLLSVRVPEDSGRHVTVWMVPAEGGAKHREGAAIEALRSRS